MTWSVVKTNWKPVTAEQAAWGGGEARMTVEAG